MLTKMVLIITLITSSALFAEESKLGLDYMELTKNQVLVDIMLDLEPKLIALYREHQLKEVLIKQSVRGMANFLSEDVAYKLTIERIEGVSPDTLLEFSKLSKEHYPTLWGIGEGERIKRELLSSLKLYKALHGKDYVEN